MEAKRQKLAELNAHRHYETFARKHVRRVEIEASRKRL
jgi:ribosomal protein S21